MWNVVHHTRVRGMWRALGEPAWLSERARKIVRRQVNVRKRNRFSLEDYDTQIVSWEEFTAQAFGASAAELAVLEQRIWLPEPEVGDDTPWESREVLLKTVGMVVAAAQPKIVVETGVERGYSSATWLVNMSRVGTGRLHSVDLPRTDVDDRNEYTGHLVPHELRDAWHLVLGPSRQVLPALLKQLGTIDVFLHDADHAYVAQLEEYRTVWPFIRPGGFLISDDVDNSAFVEFSEQAVAASWLLPRPAFGDAVGVLRK